MPNWCWNDITFFIEKEEHWPQLKKLADAFNMASRLCEEGEKYYSYGALEFTYSDGRTYKFAPKADWGINLAMYLSGGMVPLNETGHPAYSYNGTIIDGRIHNYTGTYSNTGEKTIIDVGTEDRKLTWFDIQCETAWSPVMTLFNWARQVLNCPDVLCVYRSEEPSMGLFYNSDVHHRFYCDAYHVDGYLPMYVGPETMTVDSWKQGVPAPFLGEPRIMMDFTPGYFEDEEDLLNDLNLNIIRMREAYERRPEMFGPQPVPLEMLRPQTTVKKAIKLIHQAKAYGRDENGNIDEKEVPYFTVDPYMTEEDSESYQIPSIFEKTE